MTFAVKAKSNALVDGRDLQIAIATPQLCDANSKIVYGRYVATKSQVNVGHDTYDDADLLGPFAPLYNYAHIPRATNGARFIDADLHPCNVKLVTNNGRNMLSQRLNELKTRVCYKFLDPLGHGLVVERVHNIVTGGRFRDVHTHLQVDNNGLPNASLPFPETDDGIDFEFVEKNSVHVLRNPFRPQAAR